MCLRSYGIGVRHIAAEFVKIVFVFARPLGPVCGIWNEFRTGFKNRNRCFFWVFLELIGSPRASLLGRHGEVDDVGSPRLQRH